ncbi:hypothetical protein CBR_g46750 [Chara braunii]|uniref:CCHC-type domain-containing protein n=1 Tax=Chara braunii TaxID=69332 RepID=A0A388K408_CHABU|nr:hypothetical protein CBR_g46750 [Chara braunii]|eukprot:GBG64794.1 hypothetical protein CBR_g46750 [Chara braunii]
MPETGCASGAPKKGLTLDDLIAVIDRHERNPSNIPKVDTFHFCGERVSEWLERVEQALVGRSDVVKFQRILQYVLHSYHQEVKKVIDAAQGGWERFKEGMQRKYRLGDGLLTTADLEAMKKEDFTTIGAFVQEFKKKARKVHGISEESQCAIFLGLLTASEAVELTRHGGGSTKLTWATIDRGVEVGCLDQVEQRQVHLQRQKRKERDATASGTPGVTRIVTDVLAQLGYATEPVVQRRVVTTGRVKKKEPVVEEVVQEELWEEEESVPQHLTKTQRKVRNLAQGGQGSGKAQAPQVVAAAPPSVAAPSSSAGPSQGGAPSYGQWPWLVINAIVSWGSPPPVAGPQMSMSPPIYPAAQAQPVARRRHLLPTYREAWLEVGTRGRAIKATEGGVEGGGEAGMAAKEEDNGMVKAEETKAKGTKARESRPGVPRPGGQGKSGIRKAPLWQEKEEPPIGVEEVGSEGEVTQEPRGGSKREEPIIIESDDEDEERGMEPPSVLLGKIEDLLDKVGRYQQKLVALCEEVREWKCSIPKMFLYDSGPESAPGRPGVNVIGSSPQSGVMGRPLTSQARLAQAARTRNQAKTSVSQEPSRREPEPEKRKEAVEVEEDDDEEEEDERLRREEDQRAEQRARKKGTRGEAEPVIRDGPPKRKKYAVRLEEGFDVEKVIDRLLEGHNDLIVGLGVARKAEERLDRKIKFLAKATFDWHLLLESDLEGKKIKEAGHGGRLEAMEVEIQELRALVASQAAIIESLRQRSQGEVDEPESSRQEDQMRSGHGLPGQPSTVETRQEPPMGRVILESEEARAQREAEREAFEFRAPTELATLPIAAAGPVIPLAVEEGLPPSSSEPAQGSAEGSMDVLIEAVHSMQEDASLFSPEQRIEEPLEREMRIETEGVIEGGLQRLGTPEYGPGGIEDRPGTSTQEMETGEEPLDMPQSHGLSREASEAPSSSRSQRGKKRSRKWFDTSCFFCTKEGHRALQCPKFLKDKAEGKVTEEGGRMYDRQGRRVERSADGGRAQLYRQNQEEMSDHD